MNLKEKLKETVEETKDSISTSVEGIIEDGIEGVLRGEISASETIEQVCEEVDDGPMKSRLLSLKADHNNAISFWQQQLKREMSRVEVDSGIWGTTTKAFVGASKVAGNVGALKALKVGEEHGLNQYKALLNSEDLSPLHKAQIRNKFIPNQERHISTLKAMIKMA
jgi:hypothetical protein